MAFVQPSGVVEEKPVIAGSGAYVAREPFAQEQIAEANRLLGAASPPEVLRWAVDMFHPRLTMATAFGPEGNCIIHMLAQIEPSVRIFNLDTGYQFPETLELRERIRERLAHGHLPVVQGLVWRASGMAEETCRAISAHTLCTGLVSAALRLGTIGGARCLGRQDDIGSLEPGKLADLVMWRLDGLGHEGIDDRVAALVFGPPARVDLALVGGRPIVERGELVNADADTLTANARRAHRRLLDVP